MNGARVNWDGEDPTRARLETRGLVVHRLGRSDSPAIVMSRVRSKPPNTADCCPFSSRQGVGLGLVLFAYAHILCCGTNRFPGSQVNGGDKTRTRAAGAAR